MTTEQLKIKSKKLDYKIVPDPSNSTLLEKWSQVFGVSLWLSSLFVMMIGPSIIFILGFIFIPLVRIPILFYIGYLIFDQRSAHTGWPDNSFRKYVREHPIWDLFSGYFPASLVKTHELDPNRKYIIGYHPHGVYAIALFANVVFSRHFPNLFPGISTIMTTLPANFWIPIWRDYALALGTGTCTSGSIKYRLRNAEKGTGILIALGGAEEFQHLEKGSMDLVIKKRKGFVKIALTTGSSLVPIIGFGENEIYTRLTGKFANILHKIFHTLVKSSAPVFVGKYGTLLPERHPLVTVVGKPIYVDKVIDDPTQEQIDELHKRYLDGLQQLYDDYKDTFHKYRKKDMRFVK